MRPVDADVVERNICCVCPNNAECSRVKQENGVTPIACAYMIALDATPTLTFEQTIHGHWIDTPTNIVCSECGGETNRLWHEEYEEYRLPAYCWHCGAKMDSDGDNNDDLL